MALSDFKTFDEHDALFRTSKGKVKEPPHFAEASDKRAAGSLGGTSSKGGVSSKGGASPKHQEGMSADAPVMGSGLPPSMLGGADSAQSAKQKQRFADTHCHLGMLEDPAYAIARSAYYDFGFLLCMTDPGEPTSQGDQIFPAPSVYEHISAWKEHARKTLREWGASGKKVPRIRVAAGIHPHNAKYYDETKDTLIRLLHNPLTSCLGEIGLDYHYDLSPRDVQRDVFARQLILAQEASLPVSLHVREAHDEALEILKREGVPAQGCILHCFNLDAEVLQPFLDLGCYVAFGGPLTFKKSHLTRQAALHVPIDKLLVETDAPFMAPEPLRGTLCTPDQTLFSLRCLLDCFGYAGKDVALQQLNPRQSDIEAGAQKFDDANFDIEKLQAGYDEAAFIERLYDNSLALLNQPPNSWQLSLNQQFGALID